MINLDITSVTIPYQAWPVIHLLRIVNKRWVLPRFCCGLVWAVPVWQVGGEDEVLCCVVGQVGCLCGLPVTFRCSVNSSCYVWGTDPQLEGKVTVGSVRIYVHNSVHSMCMSGCRGRWWIVS